MPGGPVRSGSERKNRLHEAGRRPYAVVRQGPAVIPLTLAEIAYATGGSHHDIPDRETRVTGPVVRDSREVEPGALFAALSGERVDGHDFAAQVVAAGAVAVLAARPVGVPSIVVDDVQAALGKLAQHVLGRL